MHHTKSKVFHHVGELEEVSRIERPLLTTVTDIKKRALRRLLKKNYFEVEYAALAIPGNRGNFLLEINSHKGWIRLLNMANNESTFIIEIDQNTCLERQITARQVERGFEIALELINYNGVKEIDRYTFDFNTL